MKMEMNAFNGVLIELSMDEAQLLHRFFNEMTYTALQKVINMGDKELRETDELVESMFCELSDIVRT